MASAPMETIRYVKGSLGYENRRVQYATSSYTTEDRMSPQEIVYPGDKDDIADIIRAASDAKIAVAIRTGGHQYSGASSTISPNIQLDLSSTFRDDDDRRVFTKNEQTFVRTSVSWSLAEFNAYLGEKGLFVPHGQCENVHIGGHVQTGGYGQLARSFGLMGDHVVSLEIVDHEGHFREVTLRSDKELFYALLGGSPGNLGVLTHFTIKVYRDADYQGSMGLKTLFPFSKEKLKDLLDILVEMADNEDFPRNYDFCISCLSQRNKLLHYFPAISFQMSEIYPEIYREGDPLWPEVIIVYAQWVRLSKDDKPDMKWFDRIQNGQMLNMSVEQKPMSQLTADWLFRSVREFDLPYFKSTHLTKSKTLVADGWASWMSECADVIVTDQKDHLFLSAQFQNFGGKNSKFSTNADNGTAYSWRDSTIGVTFDCFYASGYQGLAEDFHTHIEDEGIGSKGRFSKDDRRLLWGSFGSYDLDACKQFYYDNQEIYSRLKAARTLADPNGVFTPNTFAVARDLKP